MSKSPLPAAKTAQRDDAYAKLRQLLILQKIREGERLREPVWAKRLGVNRVALREAFARLEAEGLIERGPKTGYFVPQLSETDVREILQVRTVLECAAVEQLGKRGVGSAKFLAPLEAACDQLAQLIEQGYLLGASEADRRFHDTLVQLSGNRRLAMIYARAPLPMLHSRIVATPQWEAECRHTLEDHRAIVEALRGGAFGRAQALLRRHLDGRYLLPLSTG